MVVIAPDRDAVLAALADQSTYIEQLVRRGRGLDRPVPGLEWTTRELVAHVTSIYFAFAHTLRGDYADPELADAVARAGEASGAGGLPSAVGAANAYAVRAFGSKTVDQAADTLAEYAADLHAAIGAERDFSRMVDTSWYGPSMRCSTGTLAALSVTESLVHGWDLAHALHSPPRLSRSAAAAVTPTVMSAMLPLLYDPASAAGVTACTFEVRIRGGERFALRIQDGAAHTIPAQGCGPDCVLSLDPRTALLVGFGRRSLPRAVLTAGTLAFGRRPWLGLRFSALFTTM